VKLKIALFLFFFQNSTVYDLSNCCVTFAPHCMYVPGESSFTARSKTHTSNRFTILKKFRNDCMCIAVEHSVKILIFLTKLRFNSITATLIYIIFSFKHLGKIWCY
jgi:hypothetical protein